MDPNVIAALVAAGGAIAAAVPAFVALKPAQRAARAAEEQTEIQRDLMYQAAQPCVWADIQSDDQQGTVLHLVLGNAGPVVARNIRDTIEPPISEHPSYGAKSVVAQQRMADGILSLAPGRTIRWSLGRASDLMDDEEDRVVYRMRVSAEGPYGEVDPITTEVRLSDWREARDAPIGLLHHAQGDTETRPQPLMAAYPRKLTRVLENLAGSIAKDWA